MRAVDVHYFRAVVTLESAAPEFARLQDSLIVAASPREPPDVL